MTQDDEIAKLAQDDLDPHASIWVAHFFSHFPSTWPEREAFRAAMAGEGFGVGGEIGTTEESSGDGYWHHYIYTRVQASPEVCRRLDERAREIAAAHGVRYYRWDVARDLQTGRPRDMSGHWFSD